MTRPDDSQSAFQAQLDLLQRKLRQGQLSAADFDRAVREALEVLPVEDRQIMAEALFVRLANQGITTPDHGRPIKGESAGRAAGRARYYLHKYHSAKAGAGVVLTARNKAGELMVLLAAKTLDETSKLVLPGGYMDPASLEGEADYGFDADLEATARRELHEETGLQLPATQQGRLIGYSAEYGVTDHPDAHTLCSSYHFDLGLCETLPQVAPCDDIKALFWVKATDMCRRDNLPPQDYLSEKSRYTVRIKGQSRLIYDGYGAVIEAALRAVRDQELAAYGYDRAALYGLLREQISDKRARALSQNLRKTEMGRAAQQTHAADVRLAQFTQKMLLRRLARKDGEAPRL